MDDMTAASAALPVAEIPRSGRAAFTGARRDFVALVVRGAALELCTAGFYRFWLATAMRRHLWSNTLVDGDALEYTGRAVELLLGFLFALAILVPFYLLNFLIGIEANATRFLPARRCCSRSMCSTNSRSIARGAIARRGRCGAARGSG